jgi:hypothetical protein
MSHESVSPRKIVLTSLLTFRLTHDHDKDIPIHSILIIHNSQWWAGGVNQRLNHLEIFPSWSVEFIR